MKNYLSSFCVTLTCVFLIACSQKDEDVAPVANLDYLTVSPSLKGWELYTWPEGNTWKFSFLVGTNRLKTLSEVTSTSGTENLIRVTGVDSVKMVLNKFPAGEAIMLIGQGWLNNAWRGQYGNLQLPPQNIINEIKAFSTQKNLTFTVAS